MRDILLSFIPYVLVFAVIYIIAAVLLFRERSLTDDAEYWKRKKEEIFGPAFKIALTICIVYCAYRCIRSNLLSIADRVFVILWGIWSIFAHRDLKERKK